MAYALTRKDHSRLKGRLTRAVRSGNPDRVIAERDYAFAIFERDGYPDDWARWERAAEDAGWSRRMHA